MVLLYLSLGYNLYIGFSWAFFSIAPSFKISYSFFDDSYLYIKLLLKSISLL